MASSINELLSNKQLALDSPQSNQIFNLLGGGIRIEGEYVPVDLNKVYVALNSLPSDRLVENKEFINPKYKLSSETGPHNEVHPKS